MRKRYCDMTQQFNLFCPLVVTDNKFSTLWVERRRKTILARNKAVYLNKENNYFLVSVVLGELLLIRTHESKTWKLTRLLHNLFMNLKKILEMK